MQQTVTQTVTRLYKDEVTVLSKVSATPTITWAPQLVYSPGYFLHNGEVYDLTLPGLYRFFNPMVNTTQMTVFGGDPVALLSAAAWLTTFGDDDRRKPAETAAQFLSRLQSKAYTSKLQLLCGETVQFARERVLGSLVPHRNVHFLTADTPNGYVDGHVAVEVQIGGNWVLGDVSLNYLIKNAAGARLSAADVVGEIAADTWVYEPLADDGYAVEFAGNYAFDSAGYAETFLRTELQRRAWHRRIFQIPGILDTDGNVYFYMPPGTESRQSWVLGLQSNYRVLTKAAWMAKFYP